MKKRGTRRGLIFETYSNGRQVVRKNGKFAKVASLDCTVCPECRRINVHKTEPRYVNGFIDPASMKPIIPTHCHACGADLTTA
jgi:ssDNA-binding Zn-finger/Zn-ribbon topoisomerase 1